MASDRQEPTPEPPDGPFRESQLEDPEYRERLMHKLNCLIAVLEVANAKVKRSLAGPAPDVDRLTRIRTNLSSTLEVCTRAKKALERRNPLPDGLPENLAEVVRRADKPRVVRVRRPMPRGAHVEMSSPEEHKRFEEMGPIKRSGLGQVDLDDLSRRLQD